MIKAINGWHVFAMFGLGFGTIIAVNLTLAINAVQTFPGLEVKNSYVASQGFDANRSAQEALEWDVVATLSGDILTLSFTKGDVAVEPKIVQAIFGQATSVSADQHPQFEFRDGAFVASVSAEPGNWNLRIVAEAEDGTRFQQRIIAEVLQ